MNFKSPIEETNIKISSPFGLRFHPVEKIYKGHSGIDLAVIKGTKVYAIEDGIVKIASELKGYGYVIYIDHGLINGKRFESRYAHLSKFNVKKGEQIKSGYLIGFSGGVKGEKGAGTSTGAHLHFKIRINNIPQNPLDFIGKFKIK